MPHLYTNGIATYFEDAALGGASGPAVVLIHGHSADLRMWDEQVPALRAAGYRVIRYDVRGHGRSMAPPGGYTWESYSADLGDLLDRINVEGPASESLALDAAHVVGLSMGGGIALQFALDSPVRVLSLTLVDSALPGFPYSDELSGRIEALVAAVRSEGPRAAFERLWLAGPLFDGLRRFPARFQRVRDMVGGFLEGLALDRLHEALTGVEMARRLVDLQSIPGLLADHQVAAIAFDDRGYRGTRAPVFHYVNPIPTTALSITLWRKPRKRGQAVDFTDCCGQPGKRNRARGRSAATGLILKCGINPRFFNNL